MSEPLTVEMVAVTICQGYGLASGDVAGISAILVAAHDKWRYEGLDTTDLQELKLIDAYKKLLLPSACGISGHWAVDWVEQKRRLDISSGMGCDIAAHCRACLREREKFNAGADALAVAIRAHVKVKL